MKGFDNLPQHGRFSWEPAAEPCDNVISLSGCERHKPEILNGETGFNLALEGQYEVGGFSGAGTTDPALQFRVEVYTGIPGCRFCTWVRFYW